MKIYEAKAFLEENGYVVEEATPIKNGRQRNALSVKSGNIAPLLYEEMLEDIESADRLISIVADAIDGAPTIDTDNLLTRENLKNNVVSCVRHETSDDTIVKYPVFEDLEEYVRLRIDDNASIVLKPEHLDMAGVTEEELREWARANLRKNVVIADIYTVLAGLLGASADGIIPEATEPKLFVATNKTKTNAASVMLLDDVLNDFCIEHSIRHLAIIPSSTHEVLFLDGDNAENINLDSMIQEVNISEVSEDDRLSDHAYYFTPAC